MTIDVMLRQVWALRKDANVQAVRNFVKKLRRKRGGDPASRFTGETEAYGDTDTGNCSLAG